MKQIEKEHDKEHSDKEKVAPSGNVAATGSLPTPVVKTETHYKKKKEKDDASSSSSSEDENGVKKPKDKKKGGFGLNIGLPSIHLPSGKGKSDNEKSTVDNEKDKNKVLFYLLLLLADPLKASR